MYVCVWYTHGLVSCEFYILIYLQKLFVHPMYIITKPTTCMVKYIYICARVYVCTCVRVCVGCVYVVIVGVCIRVYMRACVCVCVCARARVRVFCANER